MMVIPNMGPPAPPDRRKRVRWATRVRWSLLLGLMVLIYGSHAPLIALTKVDGRVPFRPSSCVILIELAKFLVSLAALPLSGGGGGGGGVSSLRVAPPLAAPYAVPAVLYALNNNLVVVMQAHMDPSSYQVLSNLKIASAALLYSACLGVKLRRVQWLALGILTGAGALHSYSSLDSGVPPAGTDAQASPRLHVTAWGLVLMLVYCSVSGLAAVYTERVLKGQRRLPLAVQNLYLYAFGLAVNGLSHAYGGGAGERGFLEGFSAVVWAVVAGQAANGLLMSVVLKHGSGVTRLFVISSSMLVNALLSWAALGLQLTPLFLLPVAMVGLAAYLYYS